MPNPQNQQSTNRHSAAFQDLLFMPALTLMVFMRRRIGLRTLKPQTLVCAVMVLYLYSGFGVALMGGTKADMHVVQAFDVAFAILAIAHYLRSWREFNRGVRLHSYSSGISHIEVQNRLPAFFKSHRRIYRMVDPFVCMIIGLYVMPLSPALGLWIVLSSFSLRVFEQARYEAALRREFEIVDGLTEAEYQQLIVEFFSGRPTKAPQKKRSGDALSNGIPTGLAPDIEAHIAKRRKGGDQTASPT